MDGGQLAGELDELIAGAALPGAPRGSLDEGDRGAGGPAEESAVLEDILAEGGATLALGGAIEDAVKLHCLSPFESLVA